MDVMNDQHLIPTMCAICEMPTSSRVVYEASLGTGRVGSEHFSSRRRPDRLHYRMVRCERCGLIRSSPILPPERIAELYTASYIDTNFEIETRWARKLQGDFVRRFIPPQTRGSLLEIGCWNGFFLEEALAQGFREVIGVEPSQETKQKAAPHIRNRIISDTFRPGLFPPERFDVIVCFQVLDHLSAPAEAMREAYNLLRPGGLILAINHNVEAWSAKLLGERSPIFDIGHTYLFSPKTMRLLFERSGFRIQWLSSVANTYPLRYWLHLAPLPDRLKTLGERALHTLHLDELPLRLFAGNLGLAAQKDPFRRTYMSTVRRDRVCT